MPWKEYSLMNERLRFVARRLPGEPAAEQWSPIRARRSSRPLRRRPSARTFENVLALLVRLRFEGSNQTA